MYAGLQGKAAVVTGAARGIGLAIARLLGAAGARVVVADIAKRELDETVERLRAEGLEASGQVVDVTAAAEVEALFDAVRASHGGAQFLVNNAAVVTQGRLAEFPDADWDRVLDVNLKGVYLCTKHFARDAIAHRGSKGVSPWGDSAGGAIVNLASMSYKGMTQQIAYASSKGGVVSLTRSAAMDLARHGIRVNCVAPGMTETEMTRVDDGARDALRDRMTPAIPLRRFAQPDEIAHPVAFLLSDAASYLTGETLHVSGGARL